MAAVKLEKPPPARTHRRPVAAGCDIAPLIIIIVAIAIVAIAAAIGVAENPLRAAANNDPAVQKVQNC